MMRMQAPSNQMNGEWKLSSSTVCRYDQLITFSEETTAINLESKQYFQNASYLLIPKNVSFIDPEVLPYWKYIYTIEVDENNLYFKAKDNILFSKDETKLIFYSPNKTDSSYQIPPTVKVIGKNSFSYCQNLKMITVSKDVATIELPQFSNCDKLASVSVLPENKFYQSCNGILYTKNFETLIFYPPMKQNTEYVVPEETKTICADALRSDLIYLTISKGVTHLDPSSFSCLKGVEEIIMNASITEIDDNYFANLNKLKSITISPTITSISPNAFKDCTSLKTIIIDPNNPKYDVLDGLLYTKSLESFLWCPYCNSGTLKLPKGLKSFDSSCWQSKSMINEIIFPETVSKIEAIAFQNFPQLQSISVDSNNKYFASNEGLLFTINLEKLLFYPPCYSPVNKYLKLPQGLQELNPGCFFQGETKYDIYDIYDKYAYQYQFRRMRRNQHHHHYDYKPYIQADKAESYLGYGMVIQVPDTVTKIDFRFFLYFSNQKLAAIFVDKKNQYYESDKGILYTKGKKNLICCPPKNPAERINIPYGETTILNDQFFMCGNLNFIAIPNTVKAIGNGAFSGCQGIHSIYIPPSVTSIGPDLFTNCDNLQTISISAQVPDIKDRVRSLGIPDNSEVTMFSPTT